MLIFFDLQNFRRFSSFCDSNRIFLYFSSLAKFYTDLKLDDPKVTSKVHKRNGYDDNSNNNKNNSNNNKNNSNNNNELIWGGEEHWDDSDPGRK